MKRIYKLNGKEKTLDELLEYLENKLVYDGDTGQFEKLGINFEDVEDKLTKSEQKKIIEDYDFACKIAERYKNCELEELYNLYTSLGYHCYNKYENLFYMEIGELTLLYCVGGIDKMIQVWENEEWVNTTIEELKKDMG